MEAERCGGREVWSWGAGTHGQLACGTLVDALSPQRVEALSHAAPIVDMACGGAHGVAVFGTTPALNLVLKSSFLRTCSAFRIRSKVLHFYFLTLCISESICAYSVQSRRIAQS
jgi:hypothetical protein